MRPSIEGSKFLRHLAEYKVASQRAWQDFNTAKNKRTFPVIKADWNEASAAPSPKVKKAIVGFVKKSPINWYPDVDASELRASISAYVKLPTNCIRVFNGSDSALEYICRAFVNPSDQVVIRVPSYDNFRVYAQTCGARIVRVECSTPFRFETDKILSAITRNTKLIYLVNPNNPSGARCSRRQIIDIMSMAPKSILIVDEAYFEFGGATVADLVLKYPNLIVTRSFSKAFSLAGLRCGYVLTDPKNATLLDKIRVGKNVNSLAQVAAQAALDDIKYTHKYIKRVREVKAYLLKALRQIGARVVDTPANFILLEVKTPAKLIEYLEQFHIYIRDTSCQPQLHKYVRITVGDLPQMKKVAARIAIFMSQEK